MEKEVMCRKPHKCELCGNEIKKGERAFYYEGKMPAFDNDSEVQTGIHYYHCWAHLKSCALDLIFEPKTQE